MWSTGVACLTHQEILLLPKLFLEVGPKDSNLPIVATTTLSEMEMASIRTLRETFQTGGKMKPAKFLKGILRNTSWLPLWNSASWKRREEHVLDSHEWKPF